MDNLEKINHIPFLDIFAKLWIQTEKDTIVNEYKVQIPWDWRISNWSYKLNTQKNAVYANWQDRPSWGPFYFIKKTLHTIDDREVYKWFENNFWIKTEFEKPKKNVIKKEILNNFNKFIIWKDFNQEKIWAIKTWLVNRWFEHKYVNSDEWLLKIKEVFKNIWYCENPSTKQNSKKEWLATKPVLIFPWLDKDWNIIWVKMRKINNKPEDEEEIWKASKSINITWSKSWIIYHSLSHIKSCETIIIVEWEPDYIVMRMLWFDNVIWNLWWVQACKEIIKDLIKFSSSVIVAYDNDGPWRDAAKNLAKFCKRQMTYIKYIDRKNVDWELYNDINEYYEWGFNFDDFNNMLNKSYEIKEEDDWRWIYNSKDAKTILALSNKKCYIYLRQIYQYYDIYENKIVKKDDVCTWSWMDGKELKEQLENWEIKIFYNTCYRKWWKKDHYNTLDEKIMLQPSEQPFLHKDIEFLIHNLCWNKKENIEWLHKAILYKYTHINDVLIPAVLFKWVWGSGKWTFMRLLSMIFNDENVMKWLWTSSLISDFCPYTWWKIIVEINELWWWNHKDATRILDKLKSLIFEPTIMVNPKGIQPYNTDNIAWFIMSSNHSKPLQLDTWSSGNRRFSIITTGPGIPISKWEIINNSINNEDNIKNYLAWLYKTFPEIEFSKSYTALDNEDKRLLVEASEPVTEKFFIWFQEKFPKINKLTNKERDTLIDYYRMEIWEEWFWFEKKYTVTYFNSNLPHHVFYKKASIRWKTYNSYIINKNIPDWEKWYFLTEKFQENNPTTTAINFLKHI